MPELDTHRRTEAEVTVNDSMPPVLRTFCAVVLGLSALSALYCLLMLVVLHRHYPYTWPFFYPEARFSDFTIYQVKFQLFHRPEFFTTYFPFTYPAPMALLYELFFKGLGRYATPVFLVFICLAFLVPAILFRRALVARGLRPLHASLLTWTALLLSWPALLLFDRANVEVFVWVALAVGTWAYARGKEWTAAALFGVAASLKLFPFVFLALFLTRKKLPKLVFGAAVFFVTTVISLAVLGPTIAAAYRGIQQGLQYFHDSYMAQFLPNEGGLDHSMLATLKLFAVAATYPHHHGVAAKLLSLYLPATAIAGLALYFLRIRKMPWLNQLLLLTIVSIYFTPFSGDGTLIHLYYAFALCCFLAVDAWRRGIEVRGLQLIFLCFGYLFATESFVIVRGVRFEGQGKCVALGILLYAALRYPLGPPVVEDEALEVKGELAYPDARRLQAQV